MLKAALECEIDCAGIVLGTDGPLGRLVVMRDDPEIAPVLQRHRMVVLARPTVERRLVEAGRLAVRGTAIAVVATHEVPRVCAAIDRGGDARPRGLVVLAVDDPVGSPGVPVRRYFEDLDVPVVEPGDLEELRQDIEHAAMFADALGRPVAVVVDEQVLRTSTTLSFRPNRVVETLDTAAALRRRRVARGLAESELVQITRRLGLDQTAAMPSPGEREVLGILATGIASMSVRHLLEELRLTGRVPTVLLPRRASDRSPRRSRDCSSGVVSCSCSRTGPDSSHRSCSKRPIGSARRGRTWRRSPGGISPATS